MKRECLCCLATIAFLGAGSHIARSEVALSVAARNIEYSKHLLHAARGAVAISEFGGAENCFLVVSAERRYRKFQPIDVRIALGNIGSDTRINKVGGADSTAWNYVFSVLTPDGNRAALTPYGKKALDPYSSADFMFHRLIAAPFFAGSQIVENIQLNRYFDMTQTGKYLVVVSRKIFARRREVKVQMVGSFVFYAGKSMVEVFAEPITLTVE